MVKITRVGKILSIIHLLILPVLFVSIFLLVNLFQQISLWMDSLDEWAYYLIIGLICLVFFPLPPPSRKRLKSLKRILISRFRKILHMSSLENYSIKDNLDVSSLPDLTSGELTLKVKIEHLSPKVQHTKSSNHEAKPYFSQIISLNNWNHLKLGLSRLLVLLKSFFSFLSSFYVRFNNFFFKVLLKFEGGIFAC